MSGFYNRAAAKIGENTGRINWLSDTIKVMLVTSGYTFNRDHDFASAVSSELSGTGYVGGFGGSGRKTLASKTITEDDTNDRAVYDAADSVWTAINAGTAAGAIIIKEGTSDADTELICFLDGASVVTNGGDVTLVYPSTGAFYLSTV
jgi:hypothetical protein